MKAACPKCGFGHASDWTRAVGRFEPGGPTGYHANYDGAPLRRSRVLAEQDMCQRMQKKWEG